MKPKFIPCSLSLVIAAFLVIPGCTSSNIASNKSPDFNEKLSKVFLLLRNGKGAKEFSYSFKTSFLQALSQKGITSDFYIIDELALESDKDITDKISKFNPQVVITMTQTESKAYNSYNWGTSNNINGGTFDIRILLPGSDKPVWRASLEAYGNYGIDQAVEKSVKRLVSQLTTDKLL